MPLPFKKLKQLAEMVNISDADIMIAEDTDTTRKMTVRQFVLYLKNHEEFAKYFAKIIDLESAESDIKSLADKDKDLQSQIKNNKNKLDTIEEGANKYVLPDASTNIKGGITIGDNISIEGSKLSLTKDNVVNALGFMPGTGGGDVQYITGTETVSGITRLYGSTGNNIDGAMTQRAASEKLSELSASSGASIETSGGNINLISKNGATLSTVKIPSVREVISDGEPNDLDVNDYWVKSY